MFSRPEPELQPNLEVCVFFDLQIEQKKGSQKGNRYYDRAGHDGILLRKARNPHLQEQYSFSKLAHMHVEITKNRQEFVSHSGDVPLSNDATVP
ncbi:hypothetical protein MASR2M48_11580 [Spirochaetota bacterium]